MSSISVGELKLCIDQRTSDYIPVFSVSCGDNILGFVESIKICDEFKEVRLMLGIAAMPGRQLRKKLNEYDEDYEVIVYCMDGSIGYINGFNPYGVNGSAELVL